MSEKTPTDKRLVPETLPGRFLATGWAAAGGALGALAAGTSPAGAIIGGCIGVILGYLAAKAAEDLILHPRRSSTSQSGSQAPVELGIDPENTSGLKFEPDKQNPTRVVVPVGGPYIGPTAKVKGRQVNVLYE